ncbi:hypothetical protein RJG79_10305 [Mycoplasmatota bacterium WC44]
MKNSKIKMTTLGIVSLVFYFVYIIGVLLWSNAMNKVAYQDLSTGINYSLINGITYGWALLSIIPMIEFMMKAFHKYYTGEEYKISILSKILTVISLGMPILYYGFYSFMIKDLFKSEEKLSTLEIVGLVLITLITFGSIWIMYGPTKYIYTKGLKDVFNLEKDKSTIETVSLVLASIFTLGIVWIIIPIGIASTEFISKFVARNLLGLDYKLSKFSKILLIILSVLTLGMIPLTIFLGYGFYELIVVIYNNRVVTNQEPKLT